MTAALTAEEIISQLSEKFPGAIEEAGNVQSRGAGPDEQYRRSEMQRTIETLLGRLEERYRVVLELRYMADKSYAEIAEIMDLPIGTIKTNIHRGKLSLKRMLEHTNQQDRRKGCGGL